MILRILGILCGLALLTDAAWAQDKGPRVIRFETLNDFQTSPGVVYQDGALRLAHSVFLADEMGATDFHQSEPLSDQIRAKKIFPLDSADVSEAELFFFGSSKYLELNGEKIPGMDRLKSTGWTRAKLPTNLLRKGDNDFRFWGGGNLLVEPSKHPARSSKSTDGGRTWSGNGLTGKANQQGEYLVRLRLGRNAPRGWAASPVIDLWGPGIGQPARLNSLAMAGMPKQPNGTEVRILRRTGSTPIPEDKSWTGWIPFDRKSLKYRAKPPIDSHRWAQIKIEMETNQPQETPRITNQFSLTLDTTATTPPARAEWKNPLAPPPFSSVPFVYQEPSPRLKFLREKYKLDDVIAPGKTELEQLMLLRWWIRHQWHTAWGSHSAAWMPPWDSLIILQNRDQPDCLTMCTHYACVFTQCCQALGWNARHCILDHHCVSEVYIQDFDKWVMLDTGNSAQRADVGLHFEKDGVPLSARELHLAQRYGKTAGIQVRFTPAKLAAKIAGLCRPDPKPVKERRPDVIPLAELQKYPVCQLENYRRYAFPPRNNFLSSLYPGELYQGWSEYYYDGYYWVGDSPDDPKISPEYSLHADPHRPQEADWKLNWTRIYLSYTSKPDELRVDLATHTPNLARFEMRTTGQKWETMPATFPWKLVAGENVLAVRTVNQWGKAGSEARAKVVLGKGQK